MLQIEVGSLHNSMFRIERAVPDVSGTDEDDGDSLAGDLGPQTVGPGLGCTSALVHLVYRSLANRMIMQKVTVTRYTVHPAHKYTG